MDQLTDQWTDGQSRVQSRVHATKKREKMAVIIVFLQFQSKQYKRTSVRTSNLFKHQFRVVLPFLKGWSLRDQIGCYYIIFCTHFLYSHPFFLFILFRCKVKSDNKQMKSFGQYSIGRVSSLGQNFDLRSLTDECGPQQRPNKRYSYRTYHGKVKAN